MNGRRWIVCMIATVWIALAANGVPYLAARPLYWIAAVVFGVTANLFLGFIGSRKAPWRLRFLAHGIDCLLVFCMSVVLSAAWHTVGWFCLSWELPTLLWSVFVSVIVHAVLFWNGMITLYLTSVQLGLRYRILGALCGWIPVVNLVVLGIILKTTIREYTVEFEKDRLNASRKDRKICRTRYPILLVHGVFFRDSAVLNYWGRIPAELEKNGARVFYGKHSSALSVADSAKEIAWRVREIVDITGCEKVNIIAHSKGGLDCRCAMHTQGIAPLVASLTTINTPHRGCGFADYLLGAVPEKIKRKITAAYNTAAHKLGDEEPDFLSAVTDLTASACSVTDKEWVVPDGVLCQSVGSVLAKARHGRFPLNVTRGFVAYFDGENDGLVAEDSFAFGETYTLLRTAKKRGISHMDVIDLTRENLPDFDAREWFVQLAADLKNRGL